VPRGHGVATASPVRDVGSGLPRWSPGSQFWSRGSASRSRSCSNRSENLLIARAWRNHDARVLGLAAKIGTNPGLFIGVFGMVS
jgi:hypothetical protein